VVWKDAVAILTSLREGESQETAVLLTTALRCVVLQIANLSRVNPCPNCLRWSSPERPECSQPGSGIEGGW